MPDVTAIVLQPPPYKVKTQDDGGFLSRPWMDWLRQLYLRVGGTEAFSNEALANIQLVNLTAVETAIATLESNLNAAISDITDLAAAQAASDELIEGLLQGPVL